jgi:hypothetical protein
VRGPDRFRWPPPAVLCATYSSDLIGSTIRIVSGTELMSALLHLPSQAEVDEPIFHCLLAHIEAVGKVAHKGHVTGSTGLEGRLRMSLSPDFR